MQTPPVVVNQTANNASEATMGEKKPQQSKEGMIVDQGLSAQKPAGSAAADVSYASGQMIDTKTPEAVAISKQEEQAGAGISQQKQQNFASQ